MDDQAKLVLKLRERTNAGTINWETAQTNGRFGTALKSGSITIQFSSSLHSNQRDIVFNVYNDKGVLVDTFTDVTLTKTNDFPPSTDSWFSYCEELYNMARRNASGADKVIKNIVQELEESDDIPF